VINLYGLEKDRLIDFYVALYTMVVIQAVYTMMVIHDVLSVAGSVSHLLSVAVHLSMLSGWY